MGQITDNETSSSNVKVVVRVRPENHREQTSGRGSVVRVMNEHILVFDPKEEASPGYYHGKKRRGRDMSKRKHRDLKFAFDRVFNDNVTNMEVFEYATKSVVESVLHGYNCSVFAYGATGAGKTHTMLGNTSHPGVIFQTMMRLYDVIEQIKGEKTCDVAVSYLEVYNEQIKDLLLPSGFLPVREDPQKGVVVTGLSLHKPKNAEELMHMLEFGNKNRTQHPTDANAESSRSHAVFQVFVRQRDRTANISTVVKVGKMSLIDLAGSERATVTTNRGQRFREGANINKSLLALGNCINALADNKYKGHIPYRNSKLTRLLKDSLGGNCRTVMIAAVSPSALSFEDTYNTLRYANRAKNIKANLKKNVVSVDFHIHQYAQIVEELRNEVSELKSKLQEYETGSVVSVKVPAQIPVSHSEEDDRFLCTLRNIFANRVSVCQGMLNFECHFKDLEYKIMKKRRSLTRLSFMSLDSVSMNQITYKLQNQIDGAKARNTSLQKKITHTKERLQENSNSLEMVQTEMNVSYGEEGQIPEVLEMSLRSGHLEVELRDTRRHVKHLKKLARAQDREIQNSEKLIANLVKFVHKQYFLLKGYNLATSDITSAFEEIQSEILDDREISWADQSFSDSGETNLATLLELPVLKCAATPKSPRRRRRRSHTGAPKTPNTHRKSFLSANNAMTPSQSVINLTPCSKRLTPVVSSANTESTVSFQKPCTMSVGEISKSNATSVTSQPNFVENQHGGKAPGKEGFSRNSVKQDSDHNAAVLVKTSHNCNTLQCHNNSEKVEAYSQSRDNSTVTVVPVAITLDTTENDECTPFTYEPVVVDSSKNQRTLDETFTFEDSLHNSIVSNKLDVTQGNNPNMHSNTENYLQSANQFISTQNYSTKVDTKPGVCKQNEGRKLLSGTAPDSLHLCGSATVTKPQSEYIATNEIKVTKPNVARSMTFQSPAGRMSFADVVKSPAPSTQSKDMEMSPLACQLKSSPGGTPFAESQRNNRRVTFVMQNDENNYEYNKDVISNRKLKMSSMNNSTPVHSPLREINIGSDPKNNATLHRMGLPSMINSGAIKKFGTPKYMKMTAAAANKRRGHGQHKRALSSKENYGDILHVAQTHNAHRLSYFPRDEIERPVSDRRKSLALSRSQSVSSFGRNSWHI